MIALLTIAVVSGIDGVEGERAIGGDDGPRVGCGVVALATILRLEGESVGVEELVGRIGTGRDGLPLSRLRDEAEACGVRLAGIRLSEDPQDLDRPALVHLDRGEHGHFVVIRPVGHSGTLLQVIDVQGPPTVVDAGGLYASSAWTGVALVPDRSSRVRRLLAVLLASTLGLGGYVAVRNARRLRGRSKARAVA